MNSNNDNCDPIKYQELKGENKTNTNVDKSNPTLNKIKMRLKLDIELLLRENDITQKM